VILIASFCCGWFVCAASFAVLLFVFVLKVFVFGWLLVCLYLVEYLVFAVDFNSVGYMIIVLYLGCLVVCFCVGA